MISDLLKIFPFSSTHLSAFPCLRFCGLAWSAEGKLRDPEDFQPSGTTLKPPVESLSSARCDSPACRTAGRSRAMLLPPCRARGMSLSPCFRFVTVFQASRGELGSDLEFAPAGKLISPPSADVWVICRQPQQICSQQEALGSAREQRVTPGHV